MLPIYDRERRTDPDRVADVRNSGDMLVLSTEMQLIAYALLEQMGEIDNSYLSLRDIKERSFEICSQIEAVLNSRNADLGSFLQTLYDLDAHLNVFAHNAGVFDGDDAFRNILEITLPYDIFNNLGNLVMSLADRPLKKLETLDDKKRLLTFIILRNMASLGLWRSVAEAKKSKDTFLKHQEADERAFVGAVAIGWDGQIIATGYRGEDTVLARHAEEILLKKLVKDNLLSKVCLIATNLEPCKCRNEKHLSVLGHQDGCSTLLCKTHIPVVAYLQTDLNETGRGRGGESLLSDGKLVFVGDDPQALQSSALIQVYEHLQSLAIQPHTRL